MNNLRRLTKTVGKIFVNYVIGFLIAFFVLFFLSTRGYLKFNELISSKSFHFVAYYIPIVLFVFYGLLNLIYKCFDD